MENMHKKLIETVREDKSKLRASSIIVSKRGCAVVVRYTYPHTSVAIERLYSPFGARL